MKMACKAAHQHVYRALGSKMTMTADEVWSIVRWWTRETIVDALNELAKDGQIERRNKFYSRESQWPFA